MNQYQARMFTYIHKSNLSSWALFTLLTRVAINKFLRWLSGRESTFQCRRPRTRLRSLGRQDPLEEEMATPVFLPGEVHGWGAWWATVHGFAKSWTRLSASIRNQYYKAFIISISECRKVHTCTKLHKT